MDPQLPNAAKRSCCPPSSDGNRKSRHCCRYVSIMFENSIYLKNRLKCIEKPTKWAIMCMRPLDRHSSGRVILAGDAVRLIYLVYFIRLTII